jgi:ADP-heptose:LPS heptosyltransferase
MPFPDWKKVLLVDLGFLGDTVHSIPGIRALALSGARVDVMTTPVGAEILALVPEVGKTWVVPLRKPSPPPWKNLGTLFRIRRENYDAAMTFVGSDRNLYGISASGARERIAHLTGKNSWPARIWLTQGLAARDRRHPVYEQRLSLLRELGWKGSDPGWAWAIPGNDQTWARNTIQPPALHLSINAASSPLNEWPLDDWAAVLHQIWKIRPEVQVVATGADSGRETARLGDLYALVNDSRLKILTGRLPVSRLAALLQYVDLHLGLDSGVLHLAVALGKPTVSLFRDSVGRPGWAPRGETHRVLARPCSCQSFGRTDCEGGRSKCLAEINPDQVVEAVFGAWPSPASR